MKIFLTISISLILGSLLSLSISYAATTSTSCAVTEVGDAPGDAPALPSECTQNDSGGGTGLPGQPLPSTNVQEIKQVLCLQYKVCPTLSPASPPSGDWTLDQITALWNITQRIYASPTYKALAIGNYTLEIARSGCYPLGCDGTWGYYAGQVYPNWGTKPGARLILITNNANGAGSQATLEWLIAHEIGHSASGGYPDGTLAPALGLNQAYKNVEACGNRVSTYGLGDWNENNSDILAFYMSAAEESNSGYLGAAKNLRIDFPCTYNAVKQYYFGGVEF
jgi:hypothetical protein